MRVRVRGINAKFFFLGDICMNAHVPRGVPGTQFILSFTLAKGVVSATRSVRHYFYFAVGHHGEITGYADGGYFPWLLDVYVKMLRDRGMEHWTLTGRSTNPR